jgi:hypothetical protein
VEEVMRRTSDSVRAVEMERRYERVWHGTAEESNGCDDAA